MGGGHGHGHDAYQVDYDKQGLPIGLQLIGRPWGEASLLRLASAIEKLTDAALLKRQKLEIEELPEKLQGSRAEVLEQEVFKLLKYELEREKLAMELEAERKLHI